MNFQIYYINLKKRTDRNEKMIKKLKYFRQFKIGYERIDAIDGNDININKLIFRGILSSNCKLRRGEIGCSLSHIKAWKTFLLSKFNFGIF